MQQPGYDALASVYAEMFDEPYSTPLERAAVVAFADDVLPDGPIVDVGCGIGHVAADLAARGHAVLGIEPSREMLALARTAHPHLDLVLGDATLTDIDLAAAAGILARFSLIHIAPDPLQTVLHDWGRRVRAGTPLLVAGQSRDEPGVEEFDHAVAPAWRWHPSTLAEILAQAGFREVWRTVSRPSAGAHRFPEHHVLAVRGA